MAVPSVARYILLNCLLGFALGVVFACMIVLSNIGSLRDLLQGSPDALVALFMLFAFSGLTFGSIVAGGAIMSLAQRDDDA